MASFIGRSDELERLADLVARQRLVTLTGPGGVGKTRLASEFAGRVPGRVYWVPLDRVLDPGSVGYVVAEAVGAGDAADSSPADRIADTLGEGQALLVLDNCEHIVPAVCDVAMRIARDCPATSVLATSRTSLGVPGEVVLVVEPLDVAGDAVNLFLERAGRDADPTVVSDLCRRLDGIPLAIELAAALTTVLTPAQIAERLDRRFELLELAEGRSLRAVMDGSWELLSDRERDVLMTMSAFPGGCTIDALAWVANADELDVLPMVSSLVRKSLVIVDDATAVARYRLLETIRAYATARLDESGGAAAVREGFVEWAEAFAQDAERAFATAAQDAWFDRVQGEHDNIRAALRASLAAATDHAHRIAGAVWDFWRARGLLAEGREWLEEALRTTIDDPLVHAKVLTGAGMLAWLQGDYAQASARLEAAEAVVDDEHPYLGVVLHARGGLASHEGDIARAARCFERSHTIFDAAGDARGAATALAGRANAAFASGDHAAAEALWRRSLDGLRAAGNRETIAHVQSNLAALAFRRGDGDEARARWEESLATFRAIGHVRGAAGSLVNLASDAHSRAEYARAAACAGESLRIHVDLGDKRGMVASLQLLGAVATDTGRLIEMLRLLGGAQELLRSLGVHVSGELGLGAHVERAVRELGRARVEAARETGRAADLETLISWGLAVAGEPTVHEAAVTTDAWRIAREGDYWSFSSSGRSFRLKDSKGLVYLARLLASPGEQVHALALAGDDASPVAQTTAGESEVLDAEARSAYRARLQELREELAEAESWSDDGRASRLREEIDALSAALSGALGLGGRSRRFTGDAERARVNVTRAIRAVLERAAREDAALGDHLAQSVRTGSFCSYTPVQGLRVELT